MAKGCIFIKADKSIEGSPYGLSKKAKIMKILNSAPESLKYYYEVQEIVYSDGTTEEGFKLNMLSQFVKTPEPQIKQNQTATTIKTKTFKTSKKVKLFTFRRKIKDFYSSAQNYYLKRGYNLDDTIKVYFRGRKFTKTRKVPKINRKKANRKSLLNAAVSYLNALRNADVEWGKENWLPSERKSFLSKARQKNFQAESQIIQGAKMEILGIGKYKDVFVVFAHHAYYSILVFRKIGNQFYFTRGIMSTGKMDTRNFVNVVYPSFSANGKLNIKTK